MLSLTRSKAVLTEKCVELAFYTGQFDRLLSAWDDPPDRDAHHPSGLCIRAPTHDQHALEHGDLLYITVAEHRRAGARTCETIQLSTHFHLIGMRGGARKGIQPPCV